MRVLAAALISVSLALALFAQEKANEGPSNEKAQRTYLEALDYLHRRMLPAAFDAFKKADKQDGGHCVACQKQIIRHGMELGDWKATETAAEEMVQEAQTPREIALAHYEFGVVLLTEGANRKKDEVLTRAHEEMTRALATGAKFPQAIFADGRILAYLKKDEEAKARFEQYVQMTPEDKPQRVRALRYVSEPELARSRSVPPFAVTTLDGQHISLDELQGKVVLIDFWATWCGPCRESLPQIRNIARKFAGEPFVVISISVDDNQEKWKEFVAKNEMTWPQYCDGGFNGSVARAFDVHAIPHTFTVDADGVLQDEHVGEASLEGKLKKLIKRAHEMQASNVHAP